MGDALQTDKYQGEKLDTGNEGLAVYSLIELRIATKHRMKIPDKARALGSGTGVWENWMASRTAPPRKGVLNQGAVNRNSPACPAYAEMFAPHTV